jgi:hypothetical protein
MLGRPVSTAVTISRTRSPAPSSSSAQTSSISRARSTASAGSRYFSASIRLSEIRSGLVEHHLQEPRPHRRIVARLVAQRLDEAEDRGERGAQFVARIGDEIDAHPLGGIIAGLVDQVDDPRPVGRFAGAHFPALVGRAEPDEFDRMLRRRRCGGGQPIRGGGVADRDAHVLADDMPPEQRQRGVVREGHHPGAHQQHRLDDRVEDFADQNAAIGDRGMFGHRPVLARADRGKHRGDAADQHDRGAVDPPVDQQHRDRGDPDDDEGARQALRESRGHGARRTG